MQEGTTRKLAAIVLADVAGYSRLMHAHEDLAHVRFRSCMAEIVRPLLSAHGGRIVKSTGDGFLAVFDGPLSATLFAKELQEGMRTRNRDLPKGSRMEFRVGVSFGEVIFDTDDVYGDDVNIAARLERLAQPGGIVVSEAVFRAAQEQPGIAFDDLGPQELKNISGRVPVYRVLAKKHRVSDSSESTAELLRAPRPHLRKAQAKPSAIIVLPFSCHGTGSSDEYISHGLTAELIVDLSRFKNLAVVAAHTAFSYEGLQKPIHQIRAELGVRYVLEGRVQKSTNMIRVSVSLVDAEVERTLWSESFARKYEELPMLQEDMLHRIVSNLSIYVDNEERQRAQKKHPAKMNAYDAYLRAMHAWREHMQVETKESLIECRKWHEFALALQPDYARPMSYLAYTYAWGWRQGWDDDSVLSLARRYAEKGVELAPYNYESYWDLGYCYLTIRDFGNAQQAYEMAHDLNRHDPLLTADVAEMYSVLGKHNKAIKYIRKAVILSRSWPEFYNEAYASILYFVRRYSEALEKLAAIRHPSHNARLLAAAIHAQLSSDHRSKGDIVSADQEAIRAKLALQQFLALRPHWNIAREMRANPFKEAADERHWYEGLSRAGLPAGDNLSADLQTVNVPAHNGISQ